MTSDAKTVAEYIAQAPPNRESALNKIRALCIQYLPNHQESMAYKMPSYSKNGEVQIAVASQKQYISVYILIHSVMLNKPERLKGINHGKACMRFSTPSKIDYDLITTLLKETAASSDKAC